MPKVYNEKVWSAGEYHPVVVKVPTPREMQATSETEDFKVLISNFTMRGGVNDYTVALMEKETDPTLIRMGFKFKSRAEQYNIYRFNGRHARECAISRASSLLMGYSS